MISEQISHYRILSKLGAGGMGEVYLAEDVRLGRRVALKIVIATNQKKTDSHSRFLKEARAASALQSHNIAAIYDIGEHEELSYIVMEYVQGEDLTQRLERGPLSIGEAIDITVQIADALDEAHAHGIIHRDIKASNVMINERGMVKILDFGLAKFIAGSSYSPPPGNDYYSDPHRFSLETMPGVILGTPTYMSPEQARGQEVDGRTDIFSLGVLLYRMITGRAPFEGSSVGDIIVSILEREPPPLGRYISGVPDKMEHIISRALAKEVEERYQTAREMLFELSELRSQVGNQATPPLNSGASRRINPVSGSNPMVTRIMQDAARSPVSPGSRKSGRGSLSGRRKSTTIDSLAVLPLRNISTDQSTEYLSDGITESLMISLSQLPRLRVMAPSTVFRYKGREIDAQVAGHELGVRAILSGKVHLIGENLRISAELVDVSDGSLLWGEQYSRKLSDIFSIQDEISQEISEKLRLKLKTKEKKRITEKRPQNTEAYQLFLKGRYYVHQLTRAGFEKAIEYFKQALDIDPNYALAYAGLANAYGGLWYFRHLPAQQCAPQARAAATRALELDKDLAEPHIAIGNARLFVDLDVHGAEAEYKTALRLNPNSSDAHQMYAICHAVFGRTEESVLEARRSWEIDVLSPMANMGLVASLFYDRRFDEAIEQANKILKMEPGFLQVYEFLGWSYELSGKYQEAVDAYLRAVKLSGAAGEIIKRLETAFHTSGIEGFWREQYKIEIERTDVNATDPYNLVQLCSRLNETDAAFEWLAKAYDDRASKIIFLAVDPLIDNLRQDERFVRIKERFMQQIS